MTPTEIYRLSVNKILDLAESYGRLIEHARATGNKERLHRLNQEVEWCVTELRRKSKLSKLQRNLQIWRSQLAYGQEAYREERRMG